MPGSMQDVLNFSKIDIWMWLPVSNPYFENVQVPWFALPGRCWGGVQETPGTLREPVQLLGGR
jgi:hypothetical protein